MIYVVLMDSQEYPDIIKKVGFDFHWDNKKIWALNFPVEAIDIGNLIWHFAIPFHWWNNGVYNLTSQEILDNPEQYKKAFDRAMNTDLHFPIDIMRNKGRWLILDGLHRLMKAHMLGRKTVNVRKIPLSEIPNIAREKQ